MFDGGVAQIEHDAAGKVTGVVYFDKDGKTQRQKARIVAVAGNMMLMPGLPSKPRALSIDVDEDGTIVGV